MASYRAVPVHPYLGALALALKGVGKRGEVVWFRQILNQHNKVVQEGLMVTMVECRPKG